MSGDAVSIASVGARFATCHSDAEFSSRAGQVQGGVKVQQLVSERAPFGRVGRWRGANSDGFERFWTI